ncbi:hypothetical protein Bca52824_054503 [Brassica carinata]|uniref:Amine oxidase domain-containing protein n=1 Tax=Brassica carinata TaxID=52824 RepID=A0A8X7R5W3_BRACI|nr:hypothetical protein Bca52824_054503 [Brassica carinata]
MDEPLPRANKKSGQVSYHDQAQLHELQVFAGEETRRTHYSTILGAYLSGFREANKLLKH